MNTSQLVWAKANTNIALIKYWGKRDEKLFLPMNSSVSITLDAFYTQTGVGINKDANQDVFILDGKLVEGKAYDKVTEFMNLVRGQAGSREAAYIESINTVPISSGFASSASGFMALAAAASKAYGLLLDRKELSILARQGSGSASRSAYSGFVMWKKGMLEDGSDSYSEQILASDIWELSVLSVLVSQERKLVSSTKGMSQTLQSSPLYKGWLDSVEEDIDQITRAIDRRDFEILGSVMEHNALKMHATMMSARPAIIYWSEGTLSLIKAVMEMRSKGYLAYYTIDAGANVKVLCLPKDEEVLSNFFLTIPSVKKVTVCHQGDGVSYI
jgi:diphosphomevalonate decarboxylase